jgi:hypothetical protein
VIHEQGGIEAAVEKYGPNAERLGKWSGLRTAAKVTPKASRVAAFITEWAIAMRDDDRDEYSITEFQRYWNENERKAYRVQSEFRELWPEFETPNELARQIVKQIDGRIAKKDVVSLPTRLMVTA